MSVIRAATRRQPLEAANQALSLPGVTGRFAEGLARFLGGDLRTSARLMRGVANDPESSPVIAASARLVAAFATFPSGGGLALEELQRLQEEVDDTPFRGWSGSPAPPSWPPPVGHDVLDDLLGACEREGDRWGAGLVAAFHGTGPVGSLRPHAVATLQRSARAFGEVGAGVMESTALAYASVAALRSGRREEAARLANQTRTLSAMGDSRSAGPCRSHSRGPLRRRPRADRSRSVLENPEGGLRTPPARGETHPIRPLDAAERVNGHHPAGRADIANGHDDFGPN